MCFSFSVLPMLLGMAAPRALQLSMLRGAFICGAHRCLHSDSHIHSMGAHVHCASSGSDQLPLLPLPTVDHTSLQMWTWCLNGASLAACSPLVAVSFIREGAALANLPGPGRAHWARLGLSAQELGQAHSTGVPDV